MPSHLSSALGTLYAFQKAARLAQEKNQLDILAGLKEGRSSIGLYHTAGKGTRMAPLPGAENNNKPGVKLPATANIGGVQAPITILESVIKQTGCYAKSRIGRLSVFWGDQVFIPTVPVEYKVTHHVDILCSLGPMISEEEWKEKGMDKYGLIAQSVSGGAAQVEKVDYKTAVDLLKNLGQIASVGVSLGSFSISWQMLVALLDEFKTELAAKAGKFDSDPHLWMPMTLSREADIQLIGKKGTSAEEAGAHYDRIAAMMVIFNEVDGNGILGLFGPVDVGQGVHWWDYGQLKLYQSNTLLLAAKSKEAELMRLFLGVDERVRHSTLINTEVDDESVVSSSIIGSAEGPSGFIRNCVISNVRCKHIEAEGCLLINVTADRIIAKPGSILYNLIDTEGASNGGLLSAAEKEVRVGVFNDVGEQAIVRSSLNIDGGKAWETKLEANHASFEAIHTSNMNACSITLETVISKAHNDFWSSL